MAPLPTAPLVRRDLKVTELLRLREVRLRETYQKPLEEAVPEQHKYSQCGFTYTYGCPFPLGATISTGAAKFVNFAVTATAKAVSLCLFEGDSVVPTFELILDPVFNRSGKVWHICIFDLPLNFAYGFRVNGGTEICLDPMSKRLRGPTRWGDRTQAREMNTRGVRRSEILAEETPFDWQGVEHQAPPMEDLVIYELHVRGFTKHASSKVQFPGTYIGVIEKIPYLQSLGINCVEFLPVFEFSELACTFKHPVTKQHLVNYWGYSPESFFAPMQRYATEGGNPVTEFKTMVRELHRAGISVLLDVVYNHTGGFSLKTLAQDLYYILDKRGEHTNFSGCGNTVKCNGETARELILASLRYWVTEMKVDGFRFDECSILARSPTSDGAKMDVAPLLVAMANDPVFKNTHFVAEVWDAAGLIMDTRFNSEYGFAEWNGRYRDAVRNFIKGTERGGEFARRISGSDDMFPSACGKSVNFVACHDGFSLHDLVSYNRKHNVANGEHERDGLSGVEGATEDLKVNALRQRQIRNFFLSLFISRGVPLFLMGDEYGHTKQGNNNAYCQDSELNWFNWEHLQSPLGQSLFKFVSQLIALRKAHPVLRRSHGYAGEVTWHGHMPGKPEWGEKNRLVAFSLHDADREETFYVAFNASFQNTTIRIPKDHPYEMILTSTALPNYLTADNVAGTSDTMRSPSMGSLRLAPFSSVLMYAKD